MPTGDVVEKMCTASGNCSYRFIGQCGFGCGYYAYCDYQLPRDSRGYFGGICPSAEADAKEAKVTP